MSGSCNCKCDDKLLDLNWCESDRSVENIKRSGDIVRDSEQCYITSNTEKGISHIYCHSRRLIATLCQTMDRITRIQKKVKKLCEAQHCMDNTVDVINGITSNRNREKVKRLKGITFKEDESVEVIYKKAKDIYDEEIKIFNKNTARLEQIKKDPTLEQSDGLYLSGSYKESARGSYDYYSNFSLATTKDGVEYVRGSIDMNNNPTVTFHNSDIHDNMVVNLTDVGTTSSGKKIDLKLTIKKAYSRPDGDSYYTTGLSDRYLAITHGGGIGFNPYKIYRVDGTFDFTDSQGNPLNLMLVGVVIDIDYHQGFSLRFNNSNLVTKVPSNSDVGRYGEYFNNISGNGMSDEESIPGGSMLFAGVGSSVEFSINAGHEGEYQYGDSDESQSWFMGFFGNTFKGEVLDLHIPERPLPPIKKCDLLDCNIDCFKEK